MDKEARLKRGEELFDLLMKEEWGPTDLDLLFELFVLLHGLDEEARDQLGDRVWAPHSIETVLHRIYFAAGQAYRKGMVSSSDNLALLDTWFRRALAVCVLLWREERSFPHRLADQLLADCLAIRRALREGTHGSSPR